jgi:hypothetical protein
MNKLWNFKILIGLFVFMTTLAIAVRVTHWDPLVIVFLAMVFVTLGYSFALRRRLDRMKVTEPSEFGKGLVVCLAKFSEHLWTDDEKEITLWGKWIEEGKKEPHPPGRSMEIGIEVRGTPEAALSAAIEMWMNAASDHMYDLDESAPEPLRELQDLTLAIGHGISGEPWTMVHVDRIRRLWELSCLALDKRLGVASSWGEW